MKARLFDEKAVFSRLHECFPSNLAQGLRAALEKLSPGPDTREALRGLAILSEHAHRSKLALHFLGGPKPGRCKDKLISEFRTSTKPAAFTARKLKALFRRSEAHRLLVFLKEPLRTALTDALMGHPNPQAVAWALDALESFAPETRHSLTYEALIAKGVLSSETLPPDIQERLKAQDAVEALALFRTGQLSGCSTTPPLFTQVQQAAFRLQALTRTDAWKKGHACNQVGMIAEFLRREELEAEEAESGKVVVQGGFAAEQPPDLAKKRTYSEAKAWCRRNRRPVQHLREVNTEDGRYALVFTEIDFVICGVDPDTLSLTIERLEQVKAGVSSAADARRQNDIARSTLSKEGGRLLVSAENGTHRSIDYLRASVEEAESLTLGPPESSAYDRALPLGVDEIRRVCHLLNAEQPSYSGEP